MSRSVGLIARIVISTLLVLAATMPVRGQEAALVVSLPVVQWSIPGTLEFNMNESLKLDFTADESAKQLEARVFEGRKDVLLQRARTSSAGTCIYYSSFILNITSVTGGITFNWTFVPYSVYRKQDGLRDRYYTVVIEKTSTTRTMKLTADEADKYFSTGKEILIHAPAHPSREETARAEGDYEQERSAALNQLAGVLPVPVALHAQQQSTCVVIQTNQQMAINKECPSHAQSATNKTIGE
jgi:hypothetical protein